MADQTPNSGVQGEGDYASARKFQKEEHEFAKDSAKVEQGAREAEEAIDGPEGADLEKARRETGAKRPS